MALVHCDGFGHYASAQYTDVYETGAFGATVAIGAYGPNGRSGLRFTGDYNDSVDRVGLPVSGSGFAIQGDFQLSENPSVANLILGPQLIGSGIQCSLVINTDRTLRAYRGGASGTALGSASTYAVPLNTPIHLGITGTIDNSTGSFTVHLWESADTAAQVVITVTGADTQAQASAAWDGVDIGAACNGTTDWANLVAMDLSGSTCNGLLGPVDCWTLCASARAASEVADWTLSTGSSVAALLDDATPDDDSTYCESSTQNHEVSTAVDPMPLPGRTIYGAQLYASAKLTAGSPTVKALARESSTSYLGSEVSPGAAYTYVMQPYSAMPSGAAFSTAAAFDALQWGLALTSTSTTARLTQVAVVVILDRVQGRRNFLTGYQHTVSGDDNLAAGQSNTVVGSASEAHGTDVIVVGQRSVAFNLDGTPRTLTGDGKFWINGEEMPPAVPSLDDLTNVAIGSPLADGDVLTYDSGSGTWGNAVSAGGGTLDTLTDVAIGSPLSDGDVLTYDSGSGMWGNTPPSAGPGGTVLDRVGTTDIVNSANEETVYTVTVPGGTMGALGSVRLTLWGDYLNDSGAGRVMTFRIKYGATTLYDDTTGAPTDSADRRPFYFQLNLGNTGATNSQFMTWWYNLGSVGTTTAGIGNLGAAAIQALNIQGGSSTEDSTADKVLAVTLQFPVANANLSFRVQCGVLEQL